MNTNNCPSCGAAMIYKNMFRWHCDYCGTEVDDVTQTVIRVERPDVKIAKAKVAIDHWVLESYPEEAERAAKMDTCTKLAQFLMDNDCVDFDTSYDPVLNQQLYLARFRYVDKGVKL